MKFHFLTMQLAAVLLFAALSASATTSAQSTVSFTGKDVLLEQVFAAVKKQTGYTFIYYSEVLQAAHKVTIDVKGMTVEEFLEVCLKDQPLTYKVIGQTVMIAKKEGKGVTNDAGGDPPVADIKGKITNDKGEPLAGASVMVKGTKKGTITGANGDFVLKGVSPGVFLIVSYTGFGTKEILFEKSTVSVVLQSSNSPLDQAQVIAYGTTTERLNTGDVTTVKAEDLEKQPVNNPLLALEGRVPGLFITQNNGLPGSGISVMIQGQNSITSGNDPFYVIDGVPYSSQLLYNLGGVLGNSGGNGSQAGNPLSFINPSDIESISVLKDAEATAIYGSRAANGAILITTKKGKPGHTHLDINLQQGEGEVDRKLKLMNTTQYLNMRHEAINNDGLTVQPTDYDLNGLWDTTRNTDWQKAFLGGMAQYTNLSATISGGTVQTQYLVGGTFHRETTVYPDHFADQKGAFHFSLNSFSEDQRFRLQLTANYVVDNNFLPNVDLTSSAITLAPDAPALYNKNGSINWAPDSSGATTFFNPIALILSTYQNKTNNLISNLLLSYAIIPGLEIKSNFGYTSLTSKEIVADPLTINPPDQLAYSQRVGQYGDNSINSWIIEPQVEYKKIVGKAKIAALVGTTIEQNNNQGSQLYGVGYNSDQVIADIHSASNVYSLSTVNSVYKYDAAFGRVNYNWADKYIGEITARRDGSSRFGPANQFHDFAAAGVSWIFSKEKYIQDHVGLLSFGKLRASYGTTGNDQIGDYQYLNLYTPTSAQITFQQQTGLAPTGLTNPYLQWEETKKLQFGLDLGFLKDRILFNAAWFRNRSSNELLNYALPITTGFTSITRNFPATVQNRGYEFLVKSTNVKSRHFSWSTSINLTVPQNKLIAFPGLAASSYANNLIIGEPINVVTIFNYAGVNPMTGLYQFTGSHGELTSTPDFSTDRTAHFSAYPKFYGGFGNDFQYKGLQLSIFFQFVKQDGANYLFGNNPGNFRGGNGNQPDYVLGGWQKMGQLTNVERYSSNYSNSQQFGDATFSNAAYSDASYIRLKNLSFSWQVPMPSNLKTWVQTIRLYALGQNLFTITHYKGLDPETMSINGLPPLRIVTGGLQIGF